MLRCVLAALLASAATSIAAADAVAARGEGRAERPRVWIQAGHVAPREPGYRWQTGAPGGPPGTERAFNRRVSRGLAAALRRRGVDARVMPGKVMPWGARGDVFIAVHHDGVGGVAGVGHAHAGAREYFYRGDGAGEPRPRPYADTVSHRRATSVNRPTQRRSRALAISLSRRMGRVFVPSGGARSGWGGVLPRRLARVSNYYGFRRTRARARVIVELGVAGADDRFLRRTELIARTLAAGVLTYLGWPAARGSRVALAIGERAGPGPRAQ
jgi:hypothetical protein